MTSKKWPDLFQNYRSEYESFENSIIFSIVDRISGRKKRYFQLLSCAPKMAKMALDAHNIKKKGG